MFAACAEVVPFVRALVKLITESPGNIVRFAALAASTPRKADV